MNIVFSANGLVITDESLGSGTGSYSTFLRLQDNAQHSDGIEAGFNTDANSETLVGGIPSDIKASFTDSLQLSAIPVVNIGGVDYLQFGLDIAQSQDLLKLVEFKLYQVSATTGGSVSSQAALGSPQFDMDVGPNGDQSVDLPENGNG